METAGIGECGCPLNWPIEFEPRNGVTEARHDVDLTWEDLAALIGERLGTKPVDKSTISKWLTRGACCRRREHVRDC